MQISTTIIFGLALFVFALTFLPDKYRPTWIHRLNSWQVLIGLVAVIAATLIVMTPEFYALGILGDSAFFDLDVTSLFRAS
jgi:energy-coupling factor transporter transmembrane protein EcfT